MTIPTSTASNRRWDSALRSFNRQPFYASDLHRSFDAHQPHLVVTELLWFSVATQAGIDP